MEQRNAADDERRVLPNVIDSMTYSTFSDGKNVRCCLRFSVVLFHFKNHISVNNLFVNLAAGL